MCVALRSCLLAVTCTAEADHLCASLRVAVLGEDSCLLFRTSSACSCARFLFYFCGACFASECSSIFIFVFTVFPPCLIISCGGFSFSSLSPAYRSSLRCIYVAPHEKYCIRICARKALQCVKPASMHLISVIS